MSGEELTIVITDNGMTVDAKNFKGKACTETLDKLIQDMKKDGISTEITEQTRKAEYNVAVSTTTTRQHQ